MKRYEKITTGIMLTIIALCAFVLIAECQTSEATVGNYERMIEMRDRGDSAERQATLRIAERLQIRFTGGHQKSGR